MNALDELEKKPDDKMTHLELAIISYKEYDGISSKEMVEEANEAAAELAQLRTKLDEARKVIVELREKPFTAAYTHNADKWLSAHHEVKK